MGEGVQIEGVNANPHSYALTFRQSAAPKTLRHPALKADETEARFEGCRGEAAAHSKGGLVRTPLYKIDSAEVSQPQRVTKKGRGAKPKPFLVEIDLVPALKRAQNVLELIDAIPCVARSEDAWKRARTACFTIVDDWQNLLKLGRHIFESKNVAVPVPEMGVGQEMFGPGITGVASAGESQPVRCSRAPASKGKPKHREGAGMPPHRTSCEGHEPSPHPDAVQALVPMANARGFFSNGLPLSRPSAVVDVMANVESFSGRSAESIVFSLAGSRPGRYQPEMVVETPTVELPEARPAATPRAGGLDAQADPLSILYDTYCMILVVCFF